MVCVLIWNCKITLNNYLASINQDEQNIGKVQLEESVNIINYGNYIGIVIQKPFTLKFLELKPNMTIKNFKGTKYTTLKKSVIDNFFNNLINIYEKFDMQDSNKFKSEYYNENIITKRQRGKIIYELLLKMDQRKVNGKKWIYTNDRLFLEDFK